MNAMKDWTAAIHELDEMTLATLHSVYSEMLATAHDIGYKVPDDQLVETDDEEVLRKTIRPLHKGLLKFHAGLDTPREDKATKESPKKKAVKPPAKAAKAAATKSKGPKEPATAEQKEPEQEKSMTNATAKKAPKAAAKKTAKAGTAKKAAKGKTAKANARTPVARSKYSEKAVIKVLLKDKENPTREGTGRHDRVQNLIKHDGKLVSQFLSSSLGKSGTLKYAVDQGWVKVVG